MGANNVVFNGTNIPMSAFNTSIKNVSNTMNTTTYQLNITFDAPFLGTPGAAYSADFNLMWKY